MQQNRFQDSSASRTTLMKACHKEDYGAFLDKENGCWSANNASASAKQPTASNARIHLQNTQKVDTYVRH